MFSEQRYKHRLNRLIDQWIRYRSMVTGRLGNPDVTPEEDQDFLNLKGKIAEDLTGLGNRATAAQVAGDGVGHQRSLVELLNRFTTLTGGDPLPERAREDFEREWHRHFLYLHRLKGVKTPAGASLAKPRLRPVTAAPAASYRARGFAGWFARTVVRLAFLVVAVWLVVVVVPWNRITGGSPGVSGHQVGGFMRDAWHTGRGAVAGAHVPTLGGIFDPVVQRYGPEATVIMLGILLVAVGYWIFVRMR